ncbi:MAG: hypothetical protein NVSMB22_08690 [Chloroflexota bacterium]
MAMVPNRPAAVVRRIATYSLAADVALGIVLGLFISGTVGLIVFVLGLIVTGILYYNFNQVMRTKGMR